VSEREYEDGTELLNDLQNRRKCQPERQLWFSVLTQTFYDLSHPSYRNRALLFVEGCSFQTICKLLDMKPELIKTAMLAAKPPKPTMRGKRGGRKRTWKHTFDSRSISNDECTATL